MSKNYSISLFISPSLFLPHLAFLTLQTFISNFLFRKIRNCKYFRGVVIRFMSLSEPFFSWLWNLPISLGSRTFNSFEESWRLEIFHNFFGFFLSLSWFLDLLRCAVNQVIITMGNVHNLFPQNIKLQQVFLETRILFFKLPHAFFINSYLLLQLFNL